jgi:hypothetical protein
LDCGGKRSATATPGSVSVCRRPAEVAQIFDLLYRRIAFWQAIERYGCAGFRGRLAECKSAIQQIENLRYGRRAAASSPVSK